MAQPNAKFRNTNEGSVEAAPTPIVAEKRVCVFERASGRKDLSEKLKGLGYAVVDGNQNSVPNDCLAVVVEARLDTGFDLARLCAESHPVILIAEDEGFDIRLAAARAGIEAVLTTPVDTVDLGAWLSEFDENARDAFTILIVDDDDLTAESYALALQQAGMRAHVISDPSKALNAVTRLNPDLVLLDMHMPGANGLEVAQIIRQSRANLSLPIVFLSAERDADRQEMARRIGGDDFISKPVDLGRLASLVEIRAARAHALRQVMEKDSLTGLLNHGRFKERLAAEVDRSWRTGSPLSVALLDLDHFKKVNDTYGHQAGDRVIQALAHSLKGILRRTDVVARYGGEEFAIIFLDTPSSDAANVLEKIRAAFAAVRFETDGVEYGVTLSAGVAQLTRDIGADQLIGQADAALYDAKNTGRNRVTVSSGA